jgi:hypothetical protein
LFAEKLQPSLNLPALALDEQVNAEVLAFEHLEEGVAKRSLSSLTLAWYRQSLSNARRGVVLDEVFEVVVIDVIYNAEPSAL